MIKRINLILAEYDNYEKAFFDDKGNIFMKNKFTNKSNNEKIIITNIFKQIIANETKKNRV